MVLHDLNQASRYADRVLALRDGGVAADGPPERVLTPAVLQAVFGLACTVVDCPVTGRPLVVPLAGGIRARDGWDEHAS